MGLLIGMLDRSGVAPLTARLAALEVLEERSAELPFVQLLPFLFPALTQERWRVPKLRLYELTLLMSTRPGNS